MKKIFCFILCLCTVMCCSSCSAASNNGKKSANDEKISQNESVKSVWITYYELGQLTEECNTSKDFEKKIKSVFKNLRASGFNTVTVQVRPCADAFYKSAYFPVSQYCFGTQGGALKYDPLDIMVNTAHKQSLKIEAWVNPYRVSQSGDVSKLCSGNIAKAWLDAGNNYVYVTDTNIYFNPAVAEVKELIVNGVREIAAGYQIDAIHFDDYFYPTKNEDIDKAQFKAYKDSGGEKSLDDWRRDIVSDMVGSVYSAIKAVNKNIRFGISPGGNIDSDYNDLYADVRKWASNKGYVDYLCPQIYYGFKNESLPFMKTVKQWRDIAKCDIYIGLPLYKCGHEDEYAGDSGKNEFLDNHNIISRQINYLSQLTEIDGFYIFSYSFLDNTDASEEVSGIYSAMQ